MVSPTRRRSCPVTSNTRTRRRARNRERRSSLSVVRLRLLSQYNTRLCDKICSAVRSPRESLYTFVSDALSSRPRISLRLSVATSRKKPWGQRCVAEKALLQFFQIARARARTRVDAADVAPGAELSGRKHSATRAPTFTALGRFRRGSAAVGETDAPKTAQPTNGR